MIDTADLEILRDECAFLLFVSDLKLKGDLGKGHLMFIPCYDWSRVFIANYGSWQEILKKAELPKWWLRS